MDQRSGRRDLKEREPKIFEAFAWCDEFLELVDALHDRRFDEGDDAVRNWLRSASDSWIVGASDLLAALSEPLPPDDPDGDLPRGAGGLMILSLLVQSEAPELEQDDAFLADCSGRLRVLLIYEMARRAGALHYVARGPILTGGSIEGPELTPVCLLQAFAWAAAVRAGTAGAPQPSPSRKGTPTRRLRRGRRPRRSKS